jgi:hypothetical protein
MMQSSEFCILKTSGTLRRNYNKQLISAGETVSRTCRSAGETECYNYTQIVITEIIAHRKG